MIILYILLVIDFIVGLALLTSDKSWCWQYFIDGLYDYKGITAPIFVVLEIICIILCALLYPAVWICEKFESY